MTLRIWASVCLGTAVSAAPASASADPPLAEATLSYERNAGAEACPSEAVLREQVALRLGYDPFRTEATHHVGVRIAKRARGLRAVITTRGSGALPASRELDGDADDCGELLQSVVLAVSLAVDPMSFARPKATPAAPVAPADPPRALEIPRARVEAEAPSPPLVNSPWTFQVSATGRLGYGLVPGPSLGPHLELRAARKNWALLAEGGADLPTGSAENPRGGAGMVQASLLRVGVGACGLPAWLYFCGRADVGALQGSGSGVSAPSADTTFYGDLAVAAGLDLPVTGGLRAMAGGELVAPFTRTTLRIASLPAWTTPALAASFGVGVGYRF